MWPNRRRPKAELQIFWNRRNSLVSKILPLTTLRTIDLGGKKNSGPLFSRFWAETRVFLTKILHQNVCR